LEVTVIDLSSTRRRALMAVLAAAAAAGAPDVLHAEESAPTGDVHDFDFNVGDWTAVNRRLVKRWTADPQWEEFTGRSHYETFLGGVVNIDETVFPTKGWAGLTVRVFDPVRRRWSIYWINNKGGDIGAPMVGGFTGNRGVFYGDDVDDGRPIKARYLRWKRPPDRDHWEQAFSRDGGVTWETNWTADFSRTRS
jgi:hypothetical protein